MTSPITVVEWLRSYADLDALAGLPVTKRINEAADLIDELTGALAAMVLNDRHTYRDCHKRAVALLAKAGSR